MPATRSLTQRTDAWEDWPAPVRAPATAPRPSPRPRRVSGERARRRRHLQALRRDLLVDVVAAFVAMLFILIATAGLGVVLLIEIPAVVVVATSFVIERRRRRASR